MVIQTDQPLPKTTSGNAKTYHIYRSAGPGKTLILDYSGECVLLVAIYPQVYYSNDTGYAKFAATCLNGTDYSKITIPPEFQRG
ncbi:hypothetical protein HY570_01745 [Candidatus Micrarchaeota archaeon]|nr:hypothetical protein [Candidatus Micrarchaeota archaeon]